MVVINEEIIGLICNLIAFLVTGYVSYHRAVSKANKNINHERENTRIYIDEEIEKKASYGPLYVTCPKCGTKIMITTSNLKEDK